MENSHQLFPIAVFLILLGTTVVQADTHHGPYPYMGVNVISYDDPQSALYACQSYMDVEAPNFLCHNFSMEYNPSDPKHANAAGMCGGANPVAAWHFNSGGSAGRRYFWACAYGASGSCPTGMEPGAGADGACGHTQECPVGDVQRFHADVGEPIPDDVCSNGCWYSRGQDDMPVQFVMPGQAWSGNFVSTGASCAPGGGPGGPPDNPPTNCISDNYGNTFCAGVGPGNAPPNCMEDTQGNQACIDAYDPQNCGYLNGDQVCYDDYPDQAECHFIPGGSYICFPGDEEPASPPYPDTGTPGEPATPDIQMESGNTAGSPGPIDYFNSDTVDQSSGEGGAPGPNSDKSTSDKLEIEGPVEVEVKDPVKIDEEGTPQQSATDQTIFDDIFNQTGINNLESEIANIGAGTVSPIPSVPSTLSDIDELFPTPQSCADPQLNFFGATMVIPFASMGQGLRDVLGWAFYIMTGLYLFGLVMSLPSKVK